MGWWHRGQGRCSHSMSQKIVQRYMNVTTLGSYLYSTSYRGVLWKKVFFEISQNSQENTCARVSFLRPATLFKKKLWHSCFPVNFAKFLRPTFLQNTSGRLLLYWFWTYSSTQDNTCNDTSKRPEISQTFLSNDFSNFLFNGPSFII